MTNFEKITATPETLGAFLASLPIADGPWEEAFHRMFCDGCQAENCDAENCQHNAERNNPLWWLRLRTKGEKDAAPAEETQGRRKAGKPVDASDRELLIREYKRRLARLKSGASPRDVIFQV